VLSSPRPCSCPWSSVAGAVRIPHRDAAGPKIAVGMRGPPRRQLHRSARHSAYLRAERCTTPDCTAADKICLSLALFIGGGHAATYEFSRTRSVPSACPPGFDRPGLDATGPVPQARSRLHPGNDRTPPEAPSSKHTRGLDEPSQGLGIWPPLSSREGGVKTRHRPENASHCIAESIGKKTSGIPPREAFNRVFIVYTPIPSPEIAGLRIKTESTTIKATK
jgi:hypothetical protein